MPSPDKTPKPDLDPEDIRKGFMLIVGFVLFGYFLGLAFSPLIILP